MQKEWKYAAAKRAWDYAALQENTIITNFLKSHLILWSLTHETEIVVRQPLRLFVLENSPGNEPLTLLNTKLPHAIDNNLYINSSGWYRGPPGESQPINSLFIHVMFEPATQKQNFVITDFLFIPFRNVKAIQHRRDIILYIDNVVSSFSIDSEAVVLIEKDTFNSQALIVGNLIVQLSEREGEILDNTSQYEGEGYIIESKSASNSIVLYTPTSREELFVLQNSIYSTT